MMKEEEKLYTKELYDLSHTAAAPLLEGTTYPWEALPQIGAFIRELGASLSLEEYDHPQEDVWIHKTAKIYPNNYYRRSLRHRAGDRGAARRLYPGQRPGGGGLRGGQLHRAEKRHPV